MKKESFPKILDKETDESKKYGKDKGRYTGIVLNNDPVHTSGLF